MRQRRTGFCLRLALCSLSILLSPGVIRAQAGTITDVPYKFDSEKLAASQNAFHLLRGFVDYYYLLIKANESQLPTLASTLSQTGWCVGDAHPENFGFLLQDDGSTLFTVNDIDDAGPCPLGVDFFRFLVSAQLSDTNADLKALVSAYEKGFNGAQMKEPAILQAMRRQSVNSGFDPSSKDLKKGLLKRNSETSELSSSERSSLEQALVHTKSLFAPNATMVDAVSRVKTGGGSGGLTRYVMLLDDGRDQMVVELKEEVRPSIYPYATATIPPTDQRIRQTLALEQGASISRFYGSQTFLGRDMYMRPRFGGDLTVKIGAQSDADTSQIILYESFILGRLHAKSLGTQLTAVDLVQTFKKDTWQNEATLVADFFDQKYRDLNAKALVNQSSASVDDAP